MAVPAGSAARSDPRSVTAGDSNPGKFGARVNREDLLVKPGAAGTREADVLLPQRAPRGAFLHTRLRCWKGQRVGEEQAPHRGCPHKPSHTDPGSRAAESALDPSQARAALAQPAPEGRQGCRNPSSLESFAPSQLGQPAPSHPGLVRLPTWGCSALLQTTVRNLCCIPTPERAPPQASSNASWHDT